MNPLRFIKAAALFAVAAAPAGAAEKLYHVYNVTASITYVTREPAPAGGVGSVLVWNKISNKQFINLARGRDINAVVPKNEILIGLLPDDYRDTTAGRVAVMDANTATILKVIVTTNAATLGYGAPNGYGSQGVGTGTIAAIGNASFAIAPTTVSLSVKSVEKPTNTGPIQNSSVISMSGPFPLTINGNAVPAIITSGSVRLFGKNLLDFYADL